MPDRYTKIVLTIIAAALVGLLVRGVAPGAKAESPICGTALEPCFVTNVDTKPLWVLIKQ